MSDHFRDGRFFNPGGANGQPFSKVPKMATERGVRWPDVVPVVPQVPPRPASDTDTLVTFVGHATFLVQTMGETIITDPVFAQRASPVSFAGPKRVRQPGVRFDDLPPVSLVLLSHNHYDHCDLQALRALHQRFDPRFITLLGNGRLLRRQGIANVEELDWWQPAATHASLRVPATPAQHFSARTPFDRNRALWGGFMLEFSGPRLYFAGDSGYGPHFKEIGRRFGPIDLALMPIGAYAPRWFMKDIHMNPEEAVQAHLDVRSSRSIGMHFGTFPLTIEAIDEPVEHLARAREAAGLQPEAFDVLEVGASLRC